MSDNKYLRLFYTVRYLKFTQIFSRFKRKFKRVNLDFSAAPELRRQSYEWTESAHRQQKMLAMNKFRFLNEIHEIKNKNDWNNNKRAKLWLYNLHYFEDLIAEGYKSRKEWHRSLINQWINENQVGYGNGWEPYPSSLRIVNWIKWSLCHNKFEQFWLNSLTIQIRYLTANLETHLLGNHLFSNAKALIFAGLYFEGDEAAKWYNDGINIIRREIKEQVLNDGGNFELSTMYHVLFLEDLLDILNLHRTFQYEIAVELETKIQKMISWLIAMCHPDGEISLFNDSAIGITPSVSNMLGYANRLSFETNKNESCFIDFPDSGYSRLHLGNAVVLIDRANVGPDYLPGHAHADTLSFELSLFNERVIVNSGTSVYGTGLDRQSQRSTTMHATVAIDGENSSEVWDGFRVARRARIKKVSSTVNNTPLSLMLSASHDGYKRLSGSPIHTRKWFFQDGSLMVEDIIEGKGFHVIDVNYPLHPNVLLKSSNNNNIVLGVNGKYVECKFEGDGRLSAVNSTYHPEFGLSIENKKLVYQVMGELPITVKTLINW